MNVVVMVSVNVKYAVNAVKSQYIVFRFTVFDVNARPNNGAKNSVIIWHMV